MAVRLLVSVLSTAVIAAASGASPPRPREMAGPAIVCLERTAVRLLPGETAVPDRMGLHEGGLRVRGSRGTFLVLEGDIFAEPTDPGREVADAAGRSIRQFGSPRRPRFLFYGRTEHSPDREVPLVWVSGNALARSEPASILSRIDIAVDDATRCQRRIVYGW